MSDHAAVDFEPGDRVCYVPLHADGDLKHPDVEHGWVTSTNTETVFVRFGNDLHSKGCYPWSLVKEQS